MLRWWVTTKEEEEEEEEVRCVGVHPLCGTLNQRGVNHNPDDWLS